MAEEFYGKRQGKELYMHALLLQFMVEINCLAASCESRGPAEDDSDLIGLVLSDIAAHFREPIYLEQIADEFFVSKYRLSHEFRRKVGTSVYRYIIFQRLVHARDCMDHGASPGTASLSCGFQDYANFYRAFKSEYGMSPTAYLHRHEPSEVQPLSADPVH